jgi:putative tryptophan/tyrosine transport system substrate-binding protein
MRRFLWSIVLASALLASPLARAETKLVAIANFGPNPALSDLIAGFKEALAANGFVEGKDVTFDERHVNFDRSLVPQMLNVMAAANPALMLTITTPLTQTAKQVLQGRSFPIVFAPVTDPVVSKILPSWDRGDKLITGASNMPDWPGTYVFVKQLLPNAKRLGVLYNPGDDSDNSIVKAMEDSIGPSGLELVKVGVDNVNDVPQRVQAFAGRADVVYVPASSLLQPAAPAIAAASNRMNLPIINTSPGPVQQGLMLATYSISWKGVGADAGGLAAKILKGADPASLAPTRPRAADNFVLISGQRLKALGMTLSPALADCKCVVE